MLSQVCTVYTYWGCISFFLGVDSRQGRASSVRKGAQSQPGSDVSGYCHDCVRQVRESWQQATLSGDSYREIDERHSLLGEANEKHKNAGKYNVWTTDFAEYFRCLQLGHHKLHAIFSVWISSNYVAHHGHVMYIRWNLLPGIRCNQAAEGDRNYSYSAGANETTLRDTRSLDSENHISFVIVTRLCDECANIVENVWLFC